MKRLAWRDIHFTLSLAVMLISFSFRRASLPYDLLMTHGPRPVNNNYAFLASTTSKSHPLFVHISCLAA
jgi:hypothetical protein